MLRSGRFPSPATMPARFVTGLVLVVLVLHGTASAQQKQPATPAPRGKRAPARGAAGKTRSPARSRAAAAAPVAAPSNPAAVKARDQFRSIDWQEPPE